MDSGKIMAFLQEHWCFAALVMGVLVLIGAVRNWNWLCDPTGTPDVHHHGRGYRRAIFFLLGIVLIVVSKMCIRDRWRRCSDTPEICGCPPSPCGVRMPPGSSMKMPNFRWYVVFHNESHHPHVHMVCYSAKPIVIREAVRLEELSAV